MGRKTRVRWNIAIFMWAAIAINYMDRAVLSVASPSMMKDFSLNATEMGFVMSAFFWSYALFQIPAGWLADKIGQRTSLTVSVAGWSIATALTGASVGLKSLLLFRGLLGLGEAGAYPSNAGVTAKWFPDKERTRVSAFFDSGSRLGTSLAMPVVAWLLTMYNWRIAFALAGIIGVAWSICWWVYYRDPEKHKRVNQAEIAYIREGQSKKEGIEQTSMKWYQLLKYRNIWAMCIGFFMLNYAIYFFITWFPTYLVQDRGFKLMQMGWIAMLPPLFSVVAEIVSGIVQDHLVTKGYSLTFVRKLHLVGGMLLATSIAFAGLTNSAALSVILMCVSYAGLTSAGCAIWSLPGDVAPVNMTSLVGGIQNCIANMGGALGPIVTGFIVATTHSFLPALYVSAGAALIGALTYLFLLGKVEPIAPKTNKAGTDAMKMSM